MRSYVWSVLGRWARMIIGPVAGATGLLSEIIKEASDGRFGIPSELDIGPYVINFWFLAALLALFAAQYKLYRDVRVERDEANTKYDTLLATIRSRSIHRKGITFRTETADSIRVELILRNFSDTVMRYTMESCDLELGGLRSPDLSFNTGSDIPPGETTTYSCGVVGPLNLGGPIEGRIKYSLVYGHPDHGAARRLSEEARLRLIWSMNRLDMAPIEGPKDEPC